MSESTIVWRLHIHQWKVWIKDESGLLTCFFLKKQGKTKFSLVLFLLFFYYKNLQKLLWVHSYDIFEYSYCNGSAPYMILLMFCSRRHKQKENHPLRLNNIYSVNFNNISLIVSTLRACCCPPSHWTITLQCCNK